MQSEPFLLTYIIVMRMVFYGCLDHHFFAVCMPQKIARTVLRSSSEKKS
jgi:hypothetical protein